MSPRVVRLTCGHERWAPVDWDGGALPCHECGVEHCVAMSTPDFDAMSREQRKEYMRSARAEARGETT